MANTLFAIPEPPNEPVESVALDQCTNHQGKFLSGKRLSLSVHGLIRKQV